MQDRRGFIWLSTRRGVLRYDGHSFTSFRQDLLDANSLSSNTVWVTAEDRRGWIWMGTLGGGLTIYQPRSDRFHRVQGDTADATALQARTVTALHEDAKGRMWVGTDGGGLSRARVSTEGGPLKVAFHTVRGGASASLSAKSRVLDIAEGPSGVLWLATYGDGLHRYDPATGAATSFRYDPARPESLSGNYVMSVALDEHGGAWVGTKYGGLSYVAPSGQVTRVPLSIGREAVRFVWRTRVIGGALWAGTYGQGLARLAYRLQDNAPVVTATRTAVHDPSDPHSLSDDFVLALFEDRTGTVWCGTDNNGLSLVYEAPHVRPIAGQLGSERRLRHATVTSVLEREGHRWIGTTEGLFVRSGPAASYVRVPLPGASHFVEQVRMGADGWLWICTNAGLYRYHPGEKRLVSLHDQIRARGVAVNERFFDVLERPGGVVWAGTDRGVVALRADGPVVTDARLVGGVNRRLTSRRIRRLAARGDTVWVGTTGGGLARVTGLEPGLRAGPGVSVRSLASLTGNATYETTKVLDVAFGGAGTWVATHGGGVVHLPRAGAPVIHTEEQGLPGAIVLGVATDGHGGVWATTDAGLSWKEAGAERFEHVSVPVPGVSGVSRLFEGAEGTLFVAGSNRGLVAVEPAEMPHRSGAIPAVALTGVEVMGEPVRVRTASRAGRASDGATDAEAAPFVEVVPGEEFVSATFAVLDFAWPPANRLQYRLRARGQPWQPLDSDGRVSFSNLAPGQYELEARGAGLSGGWSETPARLTLRVAPAFWETVAFRVGLWAFGLAMLAGVLAWRRRARRRVRQRLERTRRRIADDLHDDLGSKAASVALMLDAVEREADARHGVLLRQASATTREMTRDLRDAIWLVDSGRDTLAAFLDHLRTVASRMSPRQAIRVDVPNDSQTEAMILSMEQRRHLLLFAKEALHNALHHAAAASICVQCRLGESHLELAVRDDGTGFDPGTADQHRRGLRTMRGRADALGGFLSLETAPGQGTTVRLTIPLDLV